MGPIGCPETSVRSYHHSLGNDSLDCSSHLLRATEALRHNCLTDSQANKQTNKETKRNQLTAWTKAPFPKQVLLQLLLKFRHRVHNSPLLVPMSSHINALQALQSCFLEDHHHHHHHYRPSRVRSSYTCLCNVLNEIRIKIAAITESKKKFLKFRFNIIPRPSQRICCNMLFWYNDEPLDLSPTIKLHDHPLSAVYLLAVVTGTHVTRTPYRQILCRRRQLCPHLTAILLQVESTFSQI